MTDPKKQRSKKNLLIRPGFQGRIILFVVLAGLLSTLVDGYLYHSYVVGSYDFILANSKLPQELIDSRYHDLYVFGLALGGITLLITLVIAVWALFVTHRAAGAVYHVKRVIEAIRSGNATARVHLREKDEFQDLAISFNGMMDELQKR